MPGRPKHISHDFVAAFGPPSDNRVRYVSGPGTLMDSKKDVSSLSLADIQSCPIWEFTNDDASDETSVRPVHRARVPDLIGKLVGTRVVLSCGQQVWALIANVEAGDARRTEHFLTLSVERDGRWFHLARYHDFDYELNGPQGLSRFLGRPVDDVFPISYDLRPYAEGDAAALTGEIRENPRERLSRAEIIAMAVPRLQR